MIKKIFAKLMNWSEQRENFSASRFRQTQAQESEMAKARHEQIMAERDRKYVSERTVPTEGEIVGPSDSESKEEK